MFTQNELESALKAGYIDGTTEAKPEYMPKLLVNDTIKQTKVLTTILSELRTCDEFNFSVAFITNGGVEAIIDALRYVSDKGIKGKIIASSYQTFTQPKALRRLMCFPNIELRVQTENNFHAKGYLFKHGEGQTLIVGSSNLTQDALCSNSEWNLRVSSFLSGSIVSDVKGEFDRQFKSATVVDEEWIEQYERIYRYRDFVRVKAEKAVQNGDPGEGRPGPNKMQKEALDALNQIRVEKEDRALLISATGTGKTYLSAFDASAFDAKRLLFVIHREKIAKDAMKTYKRVFGNTRTMGLYGGGKYDIDADFIFTTIETMSRPEHFNKFNPDTFDYIVIDEVHRSSAESYQRVINYFKPKFLLGMSATPERTNDAESVFKTFNYNVAYELRLQEALEQDMLAPFHYHGITDITVNGEQVNDDTTINNLVSKERVNHIYNETRFYGCDRGRIKGLIFCSRKEEAKELEEKLNGKGLKTKALTGDDSEEARERAIQLLESDDAENNLEYIITVDIFNEGIDIPCINQVVMLRPTQSAIIFVQQLGRGLRKYDNKDYVVVLDFIGNYKQSFLIPIALSGDKTYNKDNIRKYLSEGSRVVPGCSTIDFDEIAKEQIYASLDNAKFDSTKLILESYSNLKARLGRIPSLADFDKYGAIDPLRIFDNSNLGSYHKFLFKHEKEYGINFSDEKENVLRFISVKFASGKRIHELAVLQLLMESEERVMSRFCDYMAQHYHISVAEKTRINVINILTNEFATGSGKNTFKDAVFIKPSGNDFVISDTYKEMLADNEFKKQVQELIDFGIKRNNERYKNRYKDSFLVLNEKYTYEDVCRILDWEKGEVALNIGGYKYDSKTKTYPVFINYDKAVEQEGTINYKDRFLSPYKLIALSKKKRTIDSDDIKTALNAKENGVEMDLFIRKNKDDVISKEFYYLGHINATGNTENVIVENEKAVEIEYVLETPVQDALYEYIVS